MQKLLFCALAAAAVVLAFSFSTRAQGVIVPIVCDARPCMPRPRPVPIPNVLPVKSINLDVKINGQVATTHVEQIFTNNTPYTLEGTYFFPIPETASIVEFAIWENGQRLVGEVRSREEARRIYNEIVRRQRDPGLLEYAGKDLFQASIFPIPGNSEKKLELTYTQVLKAESGTVAYRYPLGTGRNVYGPRPVDDVVRMNSPQQTLGTVSGKIQIAANGGLRNIYSPSHKIYVNMSGDSKATVSFEAKNNDNDLQLFYTISNSDFGMSLLTYREPGKDGYFLLQLSPKNDIAESELINKDMVFVIDTSGSMAEEGKMEKARAALLFGIRSLRDGDRFNVINFAGEEHLMESGLTLADSAGKRRGEEFVKKLKPSGGTNINDSLLAAMKQFQSSERPKMLVFMTDGLPTVGESDVEKIIANVTKSKVTGLRVFTFGVGYDVNTRLLDKIAAENSGTAEYVDPKEDLEVKVSNFFAKVSYPVLSDIQLDFGSLQTDLIYPRQLPDLFKGGQLTILGRYKNPNDVNDLAVRLRGRAGKESRTFNYPDLAFRTRADENDFLPRLWATRRVGWLVEQIRANGDNKELRDEIVELGTRYGIVTPYTSYLATDGSERELPIMSRQVMSNRPSARALDATTGSGAVALSKDARKMKEEVTLAENESDKSARSSIKRLEGKTFYLENGVWIDSEFKEASKLPESVIRFGSDEYFRMVTSEPDLARIFSVGEHVVVVWRGKVYRITN